MLKRVVGGAIALVICPFVVSAQTSISTPLAYFSAQRTFAASPEGREATSKLTALQAERTKDLDARNQKLKTMQDGLERTGLVLSPAARQEREREIDRFQVDIQRFVQDAQAEFLGVRRQFEDAFSLRLRPALAAVVKDRGLLVVINEDEGFIAWADPVADITPDVVKRLETQANK